jgi:hypothetical protein
MNQFLHHESLQIGLIGAFGLDEGTVGNKSIASPAEKVF